MHPELGRPVNVTVEENELAVAWLFFRVDGN
jgi:hypothetical protein